RLGKRGYSRTAFAFNEFCEPSVKDSLDCLIRLGAEELVCIPLFVAMGLHLGEEIPEQIGIPAYSSGGEITINGKKIKVKYTKPLEDDPRLADLVRSRAEMFLK
ncbi:MAG: cobalamin biosynthesis protein CbiX, partial [Candidatus Methanomethylophilaceae archaeon]|nr:cobalamin biosynthesis protein CbiX [Candidatus Methanomethylophilaceae archaeon]